MVSWNESIGRRLLVYLNCAYDRYDNDREFQDH